MHSSKSQITDGATETLIAATEGLVSVIYYYMYVKYVLAFYS